MYARIWWMGLLLCCVGCGESDSDRGSTTPSASKKVPLQTTDHVGAENVKATLDPVATALRGAFCGAWRAGRSEERRVGKECRSRASPYH